MSVAIKVKPQLLQKIERAFNDTSYRDAIETSSNYNNRLIAERASRLPFIDLQTGVAQNNCSLWMSRWERMPGYNQGQIYSYPARRWRKSRRSYLLNDVYLNKMSRDCNGEEKMSAGGSTGEGGSRGSGMGNNGNSREHSNNGNDSCLIKTENGDNSEKHGSESKEAWCEYDETGDIPEANEADEADTEEDEDYNAGNNYNKKKNRKKYAKRKKASEYTDAEKPYTCDLCGIKYKTRPGLSYHYAHSHANNGSTDSQSGNGSGNTSSNNGNNNNNNSVSSSRVSSGLEEITEIITTGSMTIIPTSSTHLTSLTQSAACDSNSSSHRKSGNSSKSRDSPHREKMSSPTVLSNSVSVSPSLIADQRSTTGHCSSVSQHSGSNTSNSSKSSTIVKSSAPIIHDSDEDEDSDEDKATPNEYCDFCLGDSDENKKTRSAERMISCSDCGRSAHPTCLQFTPTMIRSVQKYRWQCIECKSCGLCGTSDNDEQLLFCDDCDRGYHMYCLNPPLADPPEGSWSCHLCIEEYHKPGKK